MSHSRRSTPTSASPTTVPEERAASDDLTGGPGKRLSGIYADCFALALQLRAAGRLGGAAELRHRAEQQLEAAERAARTAGFTDGEVHKASFALVAFIDETVHSSDWSEKAGWQSRPLQLERFDRYDAGEEFFTYLEELRASSEKPRLQVLEVYYLCLALGFEGRYQLQERDQLQMLIENIDEQLRRASGRGPSDPLAPHGHPGDQAAAEMQYKVPVWAVAVAGLVLAVVLYLGMSLYVSEEAEEAVETIENVQRMRSQQQP